MKKFLLFCLLLSLACAPKSDTKKEEEWRYLYDLGMSAFYAKNYSEAIARLYQATRVAPREPKVWNALGIAYMEVEEYNKAKQAFLKALQVSPSFSEARMNLGILHLKMKDYRQAIKYLEEALQDETFDKKHIAFYHLAKVYKELGKEDKYMEYLKKATAYNPMFLEAQLELGSAYLDKRQYEEAEKLYKNLISNNFKAPEVFLNLARVYYETGRYEKAKEAVRAVLEDKQASNLHRTQAYDLLSKILIEEQRRTYQRIRKTRKPVRKEKPTQENIRPSGKYAVQIAAFSTEKGAKALVEKLSQRGLSNLFVVEMSGIYKVVYGRFQTREEAQAELERLKDMNIYGFIVEVE
ncbi:MAG: tetratricopeptide repeat protein [Aquificae bacterium]|nr:tetratricopeptide repeat protein [Aquificota bacterium]